MECVGYWYEFYLHQTPEDIEIIMPSLLSVWQSSRRSTVTELKAIQSKFILFMFIYISLYIIEPIQIDC